MPDAIDPAAFVASTTTPMPQLIVHGGNLPATVHALRDLFAARSALFDRGVPVQVIKPADGSMPIDLWVLCPMPSDAWAEWGHASSYGFYARWH